MIDGVTDANTYIDNDIFNKISSIPYQTQTKLSDGFDSIVYKCCNIASHQESLPSNAVIKLAKFCYDKNITQNTVTLHAFPESLLGYKNITREIAALTSLPKHDNIIQLYDIAKIKLKQSAEAIVCGLLLEYAPHGDLLDYIAEQRQPLSISKQIDIFKKIVRAVNHCHSHHIAHLDVKLENILVMDADANVLKLTDFGFATNVCQEGFAQNIFKGTPDYISPEMVNHQPCNPLMCDMWSLGITLFVMATDYFPFDDVDSNVTLSNIRKCQVSVPIPASVCEPIRTWLNGLLQVDPTKRFNVPDLLKLVEKQCETIND